MPSLTPKPEPWPDLELCMEGDSVGLANIRNGRALARMDRIMGNRAALPLRDDPEGERQLGSMCATCAPLSLKGESFLPRPFGQPGTTREEQDVLWADRAFADIVAEQACPLCRLVAHALRASSINSLSGEQMMCTLSMVRFSSYWDHEDSHESFRFLKVEGRVRQSQTPACSADMLPVGTDDLPDCFLGRRVEPQVSPALIRRWLQQCEKLHGRRCSHFQNPGYRSEPPPLESRTQFSTLQPSLHFVDVHFNCIVQNPPGPCRYVALSYVWGDARSLSAYKCTIDRLRRPGSLWVSRYQLPAVITDAMALVYEMGERYLWVDRLCVLQDDENKMTTINQMNVVYENALLTIVAAEGSDASAGLPGVGNRPRTQNQRCDVIGPRLRMIVPHSFEALAVTRWASRAWT
jgi:hypothetical protein